MILHSQQNWEEGTEISHMRTCIALYYQHPLGVSLRDNGNVLESDTSDGFITPDEFYGI